MITISDYANERNLSYEAVRKYVKIFQNNELQGHVIQNGKTRYLDDFAIDFLDKEIPAANRWYIERLQKKFDELKQKYEQAEKDKCELQQQIDRQEKQNKKKTSFFKFW